MSTPRKARASGRPPGARPTAWLLTAAVAAGLGLALAASSSMLPYLTAAPGPDPALGALADCLQARLGRPRLGWAVDFTGERAAAYDAGRVVVCGPGPRAEVLPVAGVLAATFDGSGALWLADARGLWREAPPGMPGPLQPRGDFPAAALAGHGAGVLAMGADGQLLSVGAEGGLLGVVQLPVPGVLQLAVGPGAALGAVVVDGALWAYELPALLPLGSRAPCPVDFLWWLEDEAQVLVACGAPAGEARLLGLRSGAEAPLPLAPRARSVRLVGRPLHVRDGGGLPFSAPLPVVQRADSRAIGVPPGVDGSPRLP